MHRGLRTSNALTAALFAVGLAVPALVTCLNDRAGDSVYAEGRLPAPRPTIPDRAADWLELPKRFDAAFADRLGLRESLLRARSYSLVFGLGLSPTPIAVLGRDNRVFVDEHGILEAQRGASPLTVAELRTWRRALVSRARFARAHGAEYVLILAPENSSAYADHMPSAYASIGPSRTDQFVAWLRDDPPCALLDLRDTIRAARALDRPGDTAYYPYGTHWTSRGALAATRAIVALLAQELPRFPALATAVSPDVTFLPIRADGDSWAGRVHLLGLLVNDDHQIWDPSQSWTATKLPTTEAGEFETVRGDVDLPSAIVCHDSFGSGLHGSLPCAFSRASFLRQLEFPTERIERDRPDVVIQVVAERFLMRPPWPLLGGDLDADLVRELAQSYTVLARYSATELARQCEMRGPIEVSLDEVGLHVRETRPGGLLILPEIESNRAAPLVLRLDVTSDSASMLSVLFTTNEAREYARGRSIRVRIGPGRSTVTAEITHANLHGRLALRLENSGATWTLSSVEARGEPR